MWDKLIAALVKIAIPLIKLANRLGPFSVLLTRSIIAGVFLRSGATKIVDWDKTLWLYEFEYKPPFFSPDFAALISTSAELFCPVMMIIGLGSRIAALALLIMTAVIEFTYLHHTSHIYWALSLAMILFKGPDKYSIDYLISEKYLKGKKLD